MNNNQEWLDSLNVGDNVLINIGGFGSLKWKMITIEKITPTRIFKTSDGHLFNNDGWERGKTSTWDNKKRLHPPTQDRLNDIETRKLLTEIDNTKFNDFPLEKLKEIIKVIKG